MALQFKLQLVVVTDDGEQVSVDDLVALNKDHERLEQLGLTLAEAQGAAARTAVRAATYAAYAIAARTVRVAPHGWIRGDQCGNGCSACGVRRFRAGRRARVDRRHALERRWPVNSAQP